MPLRPPNLDDRRFDQLVGEARRRIAQHCPEWTDLTPGDPGMALVEARPMSSSCVSLVYGCNPRRLRQVCCASGSAARRITPWMFHVARVSPRGAATVRNRRCLPQ